MRNEMPDGSPGDGLDELDCQERAVRHEEGHPHESHRWTGGNDYGGCPPYICGDCGVDIEDDEALEECPRVLMEALAGDETWEPPARLSWGDPELWGDDVESLLHAVRNEEIEVDDAFVTLVGWINDLIVNRTERDPGEGEPRGGVTFVFDIDFPGERDAGLHAYTDRVTVHMEAGLGDYEEEASESIRAALREIYDGATVDLRFIRGPDEGKPEDGVIDLTRALVEHLKKETPDG